MRSLAFLCRGERGQGSLYGREALSKRKNTRDKPKGASQVCAGVMEHLRCATVYYALLHMNNIEPAAIPS